MYVCIYVCIYVCMHMCFRCDMRANFAGKHSMCVCVCVHVCMYICVYLCMYAHVLLDVACAPILQVSILCVCVCVCVFMYVCTRVVRCGMHAKFDGENSKGMCMFLHAFIHAWLQVHRFTPMCIYISIC
jgi:hypothetical protein